MSIAGNVRLEDIPEYDLTQKIINCTDSTWLAFYWNKAKKDFPGCDWDTLCNQRFAEIEGLEDLGELGL